MCRAKHSHALPVYTNISGLGSSGSMDTRLHRYKTVTSGKQGNGNDKEDSQERRVGWARVNRVGVGVGGQPEASKQRPRGLHLPRGAQP
jgi:hypothetical protein